MNGRLKRELKISDGSPFPGEEFIPGFVPGIVRIEADKIIGEEFSARMAVCMVRNLSLIIFAWLCTHTTL